MKIKPVLPLFLIAIFSILFLGWGNIGHRIINTKTILTVTQEMSFWGDWSDSLAAHGSDADIRKSTDPNEAPKHYIDIDNYPEFNSTGKISHSFDSLVILHGYSFVMYQGILPWAIMKAVDSLQTAFQNNDFHKAMLTAADIGHYIGDSHMPLHLTRNYNGQYSGQTGIHSRYESNMINTYNGQIVYAGDSLIYINNISDFVFEIIYENYLYVDSVLRCDSLAKAFAGNTSSSTYYSKLWELSKAFTIRLFKNASYKLTCLIYTAWLNAGSPVSVKTENDFNAFTRFNLSQNYPNPFNPSTIIRYIVGDAYYASPAWVTLRIYDVLGTEIVTLVNEEKSAGIYEVEFDALSSRKDLASGIYFYRLTAGNFIETKKMILMK